MPKPAKYITAATATSAVALCLPLRAAAQDVVVATGQTVTEAVALDGSDTLRVEAGGILSVDGDAAELRSPATDVRIVNDGLIESTEDGGRAIDEAGDAGGVRNFAIENGATGVIRSGGDAIRIDSDIAEGTVSVTNAGTILATDGGQGIDFNDIGAGADRLGSVTITNLGGGVIQADAADGVRPGDGTLVINEGTIRSDGVIGDRHDGVDWQDDVGRLVNRDGGLITGQRHGVTADIDVDVLNETGGTIIGRNGGGIDADGTGRVTNFGVIRGEYVGTGDGDGDGVDIDRFGVVENHGLIEAAGAGGLDPRGNRNVSEGIVITGGGSVINHETGVVRSVDAAVTAFNEAGGRTTILVENRGVIEAGSTGISIGRSDEARLVNSGTIRAGNVAINMTGDANTLVIQEGSLIEGRVRAREDADSTLVLEDGAVFTGATGFDRLTVTGRAVLSGETGVSDALVGAGAALRLDDAALTGGAVRVEGGGLLIGSGTTGSLDVAEGIVAPRGAGRVIAVEGDARLSADAVLAIALDPQTGEASALDVGGALVLDGASLRVDAPDARFVGARRDIATAAGGVSGTFAEVISDLAFFDVDVAYGDRAVTLVVERNAADFESLARTEQARAAARAAESQGPGGALYDALQFAGRAEASEVFQTLTGEVHAAIGTARIEESHQMRAALREQGRAPDLASDPAPGFAVWTSGVFGGVRQDGGEAARTVDGSFERVLAGVGYAGAGGLSATLAGGLGASRYEGGSVDADVTHLSASLGYARAGLTGEAGIAAEWYDAQTARTVGPGVLSASLTAQADAATRNAFGRIAYERAVGAVVLRPFADISNVALSQDAFEEAGGVAALSAADEDRDVTIASAGLRIATQDGLSAGAATLRPYAAVAYRRTSGERTGTRDLAFVSGGDRFDVQGASLARDAGEMSVGLSASTDRWRAEAFVNGVVGSGAEIVTGGGSLSYAF